MREICGPDKKNQQSDSEGGKEEETTRDRLLDYAHGAVQSNGQQDACICIGMIFQIALNYHSQHSVNRELRDIFISALKKSNRLLGMVETSDAGCMNEAVAPSGMAKHQKISDVFTPRGTRSPNLIKYWPRE